MSKLMKNLLFSVLMLSTSVSWSAKLSIENYSRKPAQVNNIGGSVDIVTPNGTNSDFVVPAVQYDVEGKVIANIIELNIHQDGNIREYSMNVSGCQITIKTLDRFEKTVAVKKGNSTSCRQVASSDLVIVAYHPYGKNLPTSKTSAEIIIFEDAEKVTAELEELDSQYAENVENLTQKLEIYAGSMQRKISDEIVSKLNKDNEALGSIVQETFDSTVSADKLIEATQIAAQSIKTDHQNAVLGENEFYIQNISLDHENKTLEVIPFSGQAVGLCGEYYPQNAYSVQFGESDSEVAVSALMSAYMGNNKVEISAQPLPPEGGRPPLCVIKNIKIS